eukprot:scpid86861/ scgid7349/ 
MMLSYSMPLMAALACLLTFQGLAEHAAGRPHRESRQAILDKDLDVALPGDRGGGAATAYNPAMDKDAAQQPYNTYDKDAATNDETGRDYAVVGANQQLSPSDLFPVAPRVSANALARATGVQGATGGQEDVSNDSEDDVADSSSDSQSDSSGDDGASVSSADGASNSQSDSSADGVSSPDA